MRTDEENARIRERFIVSPSLKIPAELVIGSAENQQTYGCELANISLGGCLIQTHQFLPTSPQQQALVRIVDQQQGIRIEAAGKIAWTRQTAVGRISCGFQFCREMPAPILKTMIARGIICRRDTPRRPLRVDVTVRRQTAPRILSGETLDVSQNGLQIRTEHPLTVGERLLLTMPDGRSGAVNVRWTAVKEGWNCCGCTFENSTSSMAIAAAVEPAAAAAPQLSAELQ